VSHSKSILTSICDKVYALSSGKLVTSGDIDEAFEFYESDKE
jgi:ABC-type polysaccharide/polyol phosphate transport system ATPase subunit